MNRIFSRFATATAYYAGSPYTFAGACLIILVWALSGPALHFSDSWQLWVNTGTTISTGLLVFLVQHTQNRDTMAVLLKLDEIIRALPKASNQFLDLDDMTDKDLISLHQKMVELGRGGSHRSLREHLERGPSGRSRS